MVPLAFKMRTILLPVTVLDKPTPCESRRTIPIWDGARPFLASLQMRSTTSSVLVFNQVGARREYGMLDPAIPFPLVCIRPILIWCYGWMVDVVGR